MKYSIAFWIGFHVFLVIFLALDLLVFQKKRKLSNLSSSWFWSAIWISVALVFNGCIYLLEGKEDALLFFTGYLVEKSLSIDNLFVFLMIFSSLKIQARQQLKILYLGIFGALILRLSLILIGVSILSNYAWMYYVMGAFLCFTGLQFLMDTGKEKKLEDNLIFRFISRYLPVSFTASSSTFWVRKKNKIYLTSAMVALILVEISDVIFALDSIPAVLAITTDPFLVYTSNVFAILGLRSLYFIISYYKDKLKFFSYGLAGILLFIGGKMIISHFVVIHTGISLGVIFLILLLTVLASSKRKLNSRS
ncbi:MAG: TerC/Alx family metal homeostasis membrane protein [Chlamydiae bacterium]|nr:TerC/Alx family metal homeostasis membrane protein [Chlamydiota bacterium]